MNLNFLSHPLFADTCNSLKGASHFLSFPTWYEYLPTTTDGNGVCSPGLNNINDVWLIVAAVIEILLRVATLMAVGFVIYGGISYTTSQGSPERTNSAKNTLVSAVVGLTICVVASIVIAFIAGQF
jgi:ABC-type Fe3+ transport system permease subunit